MINSPLHITHDASRQMEELSAAVHGGLVVLHLLGVAYNWKRRNWFDIIAHSSAVVYDTWAMHKHMSRLM